MADLHIVIDSTAHIDAALAGSCKNLHVVQLKVIVGDRQWPEDDLPGKELFRLVSKERIYPKTSQPSPGDFVEVVKPLVDSGAEVIILAMSGGLSGTVRSAATAARMVGGNVWVVDSGTTAIGMVRMAQAALADAGRGMPGREVAARLEAMSRATKTMFVPGTLEYLHKGGRIGGAAALLGTILQIRPVLYLSGGKVEVLDKVRTRQRARARLVEELKKCRNPEYICIVHIEDEVEGTALLKEVQSLYPEMEISLSTGGSVLGAHLGPGLVGVICQETI